MKIVPKKSLGQNFLTDINIINKIIDIGEINEKDDILEIGPGTGNLTREIIKKKPKKIFLIEKDKLLYRNLKKKFNDKINIINEDILKINEKNLSDKNKPRFQLVLHSYPYHPTGQFAILNSASHLPVFSHEPQ